tara:strand:- start:195 stop:1202 length:1008 start_codon:yes stop_codon:yes gene_type:complete
MYNGNFQCWQRSTNTTGLGAAAGYFTADRWLVDIGDASAGRYTMTRTAGDPVGFNYGLVINCTTADTSIAAGEALILQQRFEGQDLQHLKKGTAGAETTTISFYAKIVGTATDIVVELVDNDNARHICKKFVLTTDWVRYYFTVPGDTIDELDQDTSVSMSLAFWLHGGANFTGGTLATAWGENDNANRAVGIDSIFASTDNEFYLAGVQWEVGSVATPFEHRSYGEELALCQRYYETFGRGTGGGATGSTGWIGAINFKVAKRATPTLEIPSVIGVHEPSTGVITQSSATLSAQYVDTMGGQIILGSFSGLGAYRPSVIFAPTDGKAVIASCEL